MKRVLIALMLAAAIGCAKHPQVTVTEVDQLRGRIADLQAQVERLHQKTDVLEKLVLLTPEMVHQGLVAESVPPGGREFRFNGMRYYVTPLCEKASAEPGTSSTTAVQPLRIEN